jgi:hypothetical protein
MLRPRQRLLAGLIAFEAMLVVIYAIYPSLGSSGAKVGEPFIDLDEERNISSWFSSVQLLFVGASRDLSRSCKSEASVLPASRS